MNLLLTALLLLPFNLLAAGGGQIGGGGNGCWVANGHGLQWKSIEQIYYSDLIIARQPSYQYFNLPSYYSDRDRVSMFNLSEVTNTSISFQRLNKIRYSSSLVYKELKKTSKLFNVSYNLQNHVEGLFRGQLPVGDNGDCISYSPALLTLENGAILFFRPVWNSLDGFSKELMLIHENLRLAQLFHPAFKDMTDQEIQYITALFFASDRSSNLLRQALRRFEKRLSTFCITGYEASGANYNFARHLDWCRDYNLSDLNDWRMNDRSYRREIDVYLRKYIYFL